MVTADSLLKLGIGPAMKAGGLIFNKIKRLAKIDEMLQGIENDDLVKKFQDDFEIVKGTWRGEFTTTIAKFLQSFANCGLSQAIFDDSLIGVRSPADLPRVISSSCD